MRTIFLSIIASLACATYAHSRSHEVLQKQFDYYFYAAEDHISREEYREAMSCILLCDALRPNDPQVQEHLGLFYEANGDKELAFACYKRAYEGCPEKFWFRYWNAYQEQCLQANDAKGAIRAQDELDKHQGRNRRSVYLRMRIGEITGMKWKQLEPLYIEMLEYDPENPTVLNNYAYGLATHHGDLKLAEEMIQKALAKEPGNLAFIDTYATILEKMGKKKLAEQYRRMITE